MTQLRPADPQEIRFAKSIGGAFADGAAFTNAVDISAIVPVAGDQTFRIHFKANAAGTLKVHLMRPDASAEYTAGNPADTPVVANTEVVVDVTSKGDAYANVIFTPGANGNVTYADICHVQFQ